MDLITFLNKSNLDAFGNEMSCGYTVTMFSSDGTQSSITSTDKFFNYPIDVSAGECLDFDYTFQVDYLFCDGCYENGVPGSFVGTGSVNNICSSVMCTENDKDEDEVWEETFNYDNRKWKATDFKGYKTNKTFWCKPYVMGRLEFFRKKNNGNWARRRPKHFLNIGLDGSVRKNDCEGEELPVNQVQASQRTKILTLRIRFDDSDEIAGRSDENVTVDFKVFHSNGSLPADIRGDDFPIFD